MTQSLSSQAWRQRLVAGLLALGCVAALASAALAQSTDEEGAAYWVMQRRQQRALRATHMPHFITVVPTRHYHASTGSRHVRRLQHRHIIMIRPHQPAAPPAAVAPTPAAPAVAPDFFIAVLGNGMAASLADGLRQAFPDKPDIGILPQVKAISGLVRDDYYNWPQQVAALLNGTQHIDAAVMFLGTDDHQPIRTASGYVKPDTPQWTQMYQARVTALMGLFAAKHVPLIWVGLPIVRSPRLAAAYLSLNDIYKAAALASGATYVDLWDGFEDDKGNYNVMGPDAQGNEARLRKSDGIHFTPEGANKAAQFLQASIDAIYQKARPNGAAPAVAETAPVERPLIPPAATAAPGPPGMSPVAAPHVADVLINPAPIPDISALIGHELGKPAPSASIEARLLAALPQPLVAAKPKISLGPAAGPVSSLEPASFGNEALLGDQQTPPERGFAAEQVFVDGMMVPQDLQGPPPKTWPTGQDQKEAPQP